MIHLLGFNPIIPSTILLILLYAAIMAEKINRAIVALLGAGLAIALGMLTQEEAIKGVDFNTLALLIGMMIIVAVSRRSGLFQSVALYAAKLTKGSPAGILSLLVLITAVFSAFLDNVTTVLLIAPVTLVIARELKINAYPLLFAEIFASNIGGTATLIGDPPNILIGSAVGLTFTDFLLALTPIVLIILAIQMLAFHFLWGRNLKTSEEARMRVLSLDHRSAITDKRLLRQSLFIIGLVILGFLFAHQLHLEAGTIALFGAALLLLLDNFPRKAEDQHHHISEIFGEVEWITIFFFTGLFIVVAAVEKAGLLQLLADNLASLTAGDPKITAITILWASAILSAIVDNIPFVATMIPVIKNMAPALGGEEALRPLWWALSLGACLGGNGTLIGASANLTVAGIAERAGVAFRFVPFLKIAFPMMLVSILIAHFYIIWRFF